MRVLLTSPLKQPHQNLQCKKKKKQQQTENKVIITKLRRKMLLLLDCGVQWSTLIAFDNSSFAQRDYYIWLTSLQPQQNRYRQVITT